MTLDPQLADAYAQIETLQREVAFLTAFADAPDMATGRNTRDELRSQLIDLQAQIETLKTERDAAHLRWVQKHDMWAAAITRAERAELQLAESKALHDEAESARLAIAEHLTKIEEGYAQSLGGEVRALRDQGGDAGVSRGTEGRAVGWRAEPMSGRKAPTPRPANQRKPAPPPAPPRPRFDDACEHGRRRLTSNGPARCAGGFRAEKCRCTPSFWQRVKARFLRKNAICPSLSSGQRAVTP